MSLNMLFLELSLGSDRRRVKYNIPVWMGGREEIESGYSSVSQLQNTPKIGFSQFSHIKFEFLCNTIHSIWGRSITVYTYLFIMISGMYSGILRLFTGP